MVKAAGAQRRRATERVKDGQAPRTVPRLRTRNLYQTSLEDEPDTLAVQVTIVPTGTGEVADVVSETESAVFAGVEGDTDCAAAIENDKNTATLAAVTAPELFIMKMPRFQWRRVLPLDNTSESD